MTAIQSLALRWRQDAEVLDRYGRTAEADSLRRRAEELDAAARTDADSLLTLPEAAAASGYSTDHLRHLVAGGQIPNAGKKGSPLLRRGDLPKKAARAGTFDAASVARRVVAGGRSAR